MLEARKAAYYAYLVLLIIGLLFYFVWSAVYDAWDDVGVITLSLLLILFGSVGISLYH